jgi:hypothetical protein
MRWPLQRSSRLVRPRHKLPRSDAPQTPFQTTTAVVKTFGLKPSH